MDEVLGSYQGLDEYTDRCAMHLALAEFADEFRTMLRTSVVGPVSGRGVEHETPEMHAA